SGVTSDVLDHGRSMIGRVEVDAPGRSQEANTVESAGSARDAARRRWARSNRLRSCAISVQSGVAVRVADRVG
ncbi:MAG: hypothetical protein ACM30G_12040, partial [Micromonosporaceae bacterium]